VRKGLKGRRSQDGVFFLSNKKSISNSLNTGNSRYLEFPVKYKNLRYFHDFLYTKFPSLNDKSKLATINFQLKLSFSAQLSMKEKADLEIHFAIQQLKLET
jgi:hypothetical protein